jgi:hypothetical protein
MLGVGRDELPQPAEAHDLSPVWLSVNYVNKGGVCKSYEGPEADFNWKQVASVVSSSRTLESQHWEHDCSLHRSPSLGQNGYDGVTKSLREITSTADDLAGILDPVDGTSGSGSSSSGSGSSGSSTTTVPVQ